MLNFDLCEREKAKGEDRIPKMAQVQEACIDCVLAYPYEVSSPLERHHFSTFPLRTKIFPGKFMVFRELS